MNAMEIASLFPIPVGTFRMDRAPSQDELDWVSGQATRSNHGNATSCNCQLLDDPALAEIRSFIEASLKDFFEKVYNPKSSSSIRITQSWCNYSSHGDFHPRHSHANSFLSGVFYFLADPRQDSIRFFRHDHQPYKFSPRKWNHWVADSCWFPVAPGELLIFPSSLAHRVDPIQVAPGLSQPIGSHRAEGDRLRISLAFNTFPVGELGDESDLTLLRLTA